MTTKKKKKSKKHSENTDTSTSVTLTGGIDLTSRSRKPMSLDVAYCIVPLVGTRYDVCKGNSLRDMTINSFL